MIELQYLHRWRRYFWASLLGIVTLLAAEPAIAHPGHSEFFSQTLVQQQLTPTLVLSGLGIAFLFDAGHAIAPGHGKTMVAAYLVGSRGTPQQALLLGLVTTVTHTLGVFILGLVALYASRYVVAENLYPLLSLISGLTICGVGFWLLDSRLSEHSHEHHHHLGQTSSLSGEPHSHTHHHGIVDTATPQGLITLGVAGGMVPCPAATVLLLSAIALHQAAYGILLITAFSLGLATVLVAIGLVVVYAGQWLDRLPEGKRLLQYFSLIGAVMAIVTGAALAAVAVI